MKPQYGRLIANALCSDLELCSPEEVTAGIAEALAPYKMRMRCPPTDAELLAGAVPYETKEIRVTVEYV